MALGRNESFRIRRQRWARTAHWSAAALGVVLSFVHPASVSAQQAGRAVLTPGNAAVTGFSGALPPVQIAPGIDPSEKTFIDLDGPSLRVVDLQRMGGPPAAQLVGVPKSLAIKAKQIGQVFGVALDDSTPPNIYVAASSAYGLPIVAPGPDGQLRHIKVGAPNASFMPGLWGAAAPNGGPGSIWKIDGATGAVSLFANVTLGRRTNSGPALGGLAFDPDSKSLFVADRETGFIHRFGMKGVEVGRYGHGVIGREAQGLPPVQWDSQQRIDVTSPQFDSEQPATWNYAAPGRRVFGLAVFQHRLYYAVADGLQIWSVGLKADGSFDNDAVIELTVPPAAGPTEISKITFDEQARMVLAERPAPTGASDFEALTPPAIGRVLRYAMIGTAASGRRIWQKLPDEYAIGFPRDFRNGNGGVEIGYSYNGKGDLDRASCGGFLWATGEQLRKSSDASLAARLRQTGPENVDGLQGNGTWRIRRHDEPPLESYFIDYDDQFDDDAARGHMGDIAIQRLCSPARRAGAIQLGGGAPSGGGQPPGGGRPPGGNPPGGPPDNPPGTCPPDQVRRAGTGTCQPSCPPPDIQVGGTCCTVGELAVAGACSNSGCAPGQTAIGPSNFCCNSNQVYSNTSGAQACCSGQVVNGQCPPQGPPVPPNCPPGSTDPQCCANGYVSTGSACCLANQMTSTGICCPTGKVPSGPNKSQCVPVLHIPSQCCAAGFIPAGDGSCCPASNVTTTGTCCSGPVDPRDRTHCPTQIQIITKCAPGYTKMSDGSCCNNRFVSADGKSCNTGLRPCPADRVRDRNGVCVPVPPTVCPPGEVRDSNGDCVPRRPPRCAPGKVRTRNGECVPREPPSCDPGKVRTRNGECVPREPPSCGPGEARTRRGDCVRRGPVSCGPGEVRTRRGECVRRGPPACAPGEVRNRRGQCVGPQLRGGPARPGSFGLPGGPIQGWPRGPGGPGGPVGGRGEPRFGR